MSGGEFSWENSMSMILNQSESEDQQPAPATEVTTVIGGDLTIPAGTHLEMQGIVRLEGALTIEDGGGLTISDAPTAPRRIFSRQDAERLLALSQQPPAAEIAALRSLAEDSLPSAAEIASWRSLAESLEIGKAPAMMAAVEHLSAWYTATDRQAEAMRLIGALTAPPDGGLQRLLALGEIEGRLKPQIAIGDLSREVNAMIAFGDMAAGTLTLQERARLQHERLLAEGITTGKQALMLGLVEQQATQIARDYADMLSSQLAPTVTAAAEAVRRMVEPTAIASVEAALRMVGPTVQSLAEQQRQLVAALAFVQPGLLAGGDAWIEQGLLAPEPARRHVLPLPAQPVIVEVVQVASTDWRETLAAALQEGKASPQEVIKAALQEGKASPKQVIAWLHGMSRPGQKPPDWPEVEAVALMYKRQGHKYKSYGAFVVYLENKSISISVATLKRWLERYEAATGERLRPGKGRRKLL